MTTTTEVATHPAPAAPPEGSPQPARALIMLALVTGLTLGSWWALLDPQWGAFASTYGNQANAFIFWALFAIVCLAFNLERFGFDRLSQPLSGLAFITAVALAAFVMTAGLAHLWGRVDPSFSPDRPGGVGYFAGAIFVLFAFLTNVPSAASFEHQPWSRLGLRQPWCGIAEILLSAVVSISLYAVFAAPALASWSTASPWMSANTAVGYFYSIVVVVLLAGNHLSNWPWSLFRRGRLLVWLSCCVLVGSAMFFALRTIASMLLERDTVDALGSDVNVYAAQLGVCWVFWSIFWANCAGNRPTAGTSWVVGAIRLAITFVLGAATFALYYRLAGTVLHEPAVAPGAAAHGNALGFVDLAIVWVLLLSAGWESWPLGRRPAQAL